MEDEIIEITVKQLIEELKQYPEDYVVGVFCSCRSFSNIVDHNANGKMVQLNTDEARKMIDNAFEDNKRWLEKK